MTGGARPHVPLRGVDTAFHLVMRGNRRLHHLIGDHVLAASSPKAAG
ncbi:hypothetical protein ACQP1S_12580 [Micromonospora matsumotoense]